LNLLTPVESRASGHLPSVLIAEDEVLIRFALSDCLVDRGFKVFGVGSAAEAIDVLEAEPDIDLVFSDIRMPGPLNGIDLAKWVHAHRPGLAVVLTSGDARRTALVSSIRPEEPFIAKPYDVESVADRICDLALGPKHDS
jgi:DNA-binding NtrC family response regulator